MDCGARVLERDTSQWTEAMAGLGERYGEVIELIRPLMDFQMIAFTPTEARFVEGFGRAKAFAAERAVEMLRIARDLV
jgi:putative heme iron utilization protein